MNNTYFQQINTLRFFAIFLVIIEHFAHGIGHFLNAGYYGVDLFFVISGFLITKSLIENNGTVKRNLFVFFHNRILRIFPIYYLTIVILLLLNNKDAWDVYLFLLTYSYNYAWDVLNLDTTLISHFWSLCVEEQFYLIWPFIILFAKKNYKTLVIIIIIIMILSGLQFAFSPIHNLAKYNFHSLFPRTYALTMGAFLATFYHRINDTSFIFKIKSLEWISIATLGILLCIERGPLMILITPIISSFFILKTLQGNFSNVRIQNIMNSTLFQKIGLISYGIYIYHIPLAVYLDDLIFNPIWNNLIPWQKFGIMAKVEFHPYVIRLPLYFFLSYKLASFSYKFLELPILKYKIKIF